MFPTKFASLTRLCYYLPGRLLVSDFAALRRGYRLNRIPVAFFSAKAQQGGDPDDLYSRVQLVIKGQDKQVLLSYLSFITMACHHLDIEHEEAEILPWTRRMITLLKSRHVHKRAKVQYEVRTHVIKLNLLNLTGSSASCILEYVQRNIPEAVAMQVNKTQILPLPDKIAVDIHK